MTQKLLRGRLLTFHRAPQDGSDTQAYTYLEDAGLLISDGIIQDNLELCDGDTATYWCSTDCQMDLAKEG